MNPLRVAMALLALIAIDLHAGELAIVNGRVVTLDRAGTLEHGTVLIRDDRIVAVGADLDVPAGARVVDAQGRWVTPGLFDPLSHLGLVEVVAFAHANDAQHQDAPHGAGLEVHHGLNPEATGLAAARAAGITRAAAFPATFSRMFAGHGALIATRDDGRVLFKTHALQWLSLDDVGIRSVGGTRGAAWTTLLDMLERAAGRDAPAGPDLPGTRLDLEALRSVLSGEVPLAIKVERAADIRNVLALRTRHPRMRLLLVGASEGWKVADEIARAQVPVVVSALTSVPHTFEMLGATRENAGRLHAAGVRVSISPERTPDLPTIGKIRQAAGVAVAHGLPWEQALRAISLNPAAAFGVDDRLGSIAPGKLADLVIWDGDPLELSSDPVQVFIEGREQSLGTRQAELRDRYLKR